MRKLMFAIIALAAVMTFTSCDDDRAPQSTRKTFNKQYPNAVDVDWDKSTATRLPSSTSRASGASARHGTQRMASG